ncbi:MAG: hypothetical protein ABSH34_22225 [Verrucomicrobiota bacterium]
MNPSPISKPGLQPSDFTSSATEAPIFTCPGCGGQVPGIADYIARGVKCPQCGLGFAPVEVRYRGRPGRENAGLKLAVLGALVVMIAMVLLSRAGWFGAGFFAVLVWVAPGLLVIGLLIGIFVRLGRIANKR